MLRRAYVLALQPLGVVVPLVYVSEAIAALKSAAFDIVVVDYHLPDGTALAILAAAKASSPWARRVLLTGDDSIDIEMQVRLGVVHGALMKPFLAHTLRVVVEGLV
jgi:DNA-binding NarL/FixJ family response regulator